jgi:RNA polymerase sigma-70 factor (ECF subfamily)
MGSEYACYSMGAILQASGILNLRRGPDLLFDDTYLRALKDRDQDTENHLVSYFSRPVQSKLRARLRSPELVQDARQETFLRVFSYFRMGKTLDNPASLPGFVHTVCHNVALELLRGHLRHDQMAENAPEPADSAPGPEDQMVTAERKQIVRRLLGELAEKDRELLRRVLLEEEDKDAVCREFRVDRGYLRVLLHRARLRFKAALLQSQAKKTTGSG